MIIATVATSLNQYVEEYIHQLKKLKYNYRILGLNQPWKGFATKMKMYFEMLGSVSPDEIIVVCDSYDLLFLQDASTLLETYNRLAQNKVVIGLENINKHYCNISVICDPKVIEECKITNPYFEDFIYPNAGFIMGRAKDLRDIFQFMLDEKHTDDQYGLFQWIKRNCKKCYFDVHLDFVFNYTPEPFTKKLNIKIQDGQLTVQYKTNKSSPCVVHMWAHYLDYGYRSERVRNALFPNRQQISKLKYLDEFYGKLCKPEFYYFGYWWWMIILFIGLIVILCVFIK